MHFEELLDQVNHSLNNLVFPSNWCQGRTAFGGLSAAMLYMAMKNNVAENRQLLSLSTNFVGPLLADIPFNISIEILREGKSATQMLAKATQNDQVALIATGSFGKKRSSKIEVAAKSECQLPAPNITQVMPFQAGITPEFFQHMCVNITKGNLPFSHSPKNDLAGWIKLKSTPQKMDIEHILALTDAWPPTALQMYDTVAPASSMSWYIEFLPHTQLANDAWLGFEAFAHQSANGYCFEEANLYSESGQLLALSRQTVAVFN